MTSRYIWHPDDVAPLCQGLWCHVSLGPLWQSMTAVNVHVHAHCCIGCDRRLVCTCLTRGKLHLLTCLWCGTPWTMTWRAAPRRTKPKRKARGRKAVTAA